MYTSVGHSPTECFKCLCLNIDLHSPTPHISQHCTISSYAYLYIKNPYMRGTFFYDTYYLVGYSCHDLFSDLINGRITSYIQIKQIYFFLIDSHFNIDILGKDIGCSDLPKHEWLDEDVGVKLLYVLANYCYPHH